MTTIQINEASLDEALAALEQARPWSPRVISRLETLIRTGADDALFRINPLRYAAGKQIAESEALDLFLFGAKLGLFELDWHLVCPVCGYIVESLRDLAGVHSHIHCDFCSLERDLELDDFILVTFTISSRIRTIGFHEPSTLPVEDLYYKYSFCQDLQPAHGMAHQDILKMITRLLSTIPPNERTSITLDVGGLLEAKDILDKNAVVAFLHHDDQEADSVRLLLQRHPDKIHSQDVTVAQVPVDYGVAQFNYPNLGQIPRGKILIELENHTDKPSPICVVQYPPGFAPEFLQLEPVVTGKRLLTNATFRDLFRTETLQQNEGIGIRDITFMFTDLKGSTAMYDAIGDAKAYFLVRQHFEILNSAVARNNGAIVKTIGDAIMATFMNPIDALNAARAMITGMNEFNQNHSNPLHLKIGIHSGHSVAVTLNERLDYFGQTVNIAARVQGLADGDEVYVTQNVYQIGDAARLLQDCDVVPEQVAVKGVSDTLQVYRIKFC